MGRKLGAPLPPFWGGEAGSPSNTKSPGTRPTSKPSDILIHPAIWLQQIWAENWGPIFGPYLLQPNGWMVLGPLWGRGAGSPSYTMWPGPRPTCMSSFILIRPTVWPQYTNVTDRTGPDRQRSDSIGRTVFTARAMLALQALY